MTAPMMDVPLRVIDLLRHASRNHGDVEIVSRRVEGDMHRYTYIDAYRRVCALSRAIEDLGLLPGARVATLAWNGYRHLELYYATAGTGTVCHTLNPRLHLEQLVWICNQARDEVLCFDQTFIGLVAQMLPHLSTVRHFIILADSGVEPDLPYGLNNAVHNYEDIVAAQPEADVAWPTFDERTVASLCYTSGTTGRPKGVAYTHRSIVLHSYASALPDALNLAARDTVLPVVPMFHVNAWGLPHSLPMVGAKMVLPGPALDGQNIYELCEAEGVTLAAGVPTIWLSLLEYMRQNARRFSTLERTVIGGAAPGAAMIRSFEVDHDVRVLQGWGMTETSPVAALNQSKPKHLSLSVDEGLALKAKQGREIFGVEMRIEHEEGRVLPRDGRSSGRLLVRGPWVVGTYENDVAGARDDGWFDTGDIATIDTDGYMLILDRAKDVVKSGGEWISSVELENAAMEHEAILEAAVIGMPDEKWGERPLLICVSRPGVEVSAEDIRTHLESRVARWWLPERIAFVGALPHGATGKVLKSELRASFIGSD